MASSEGINRLLADPRLSPREKVRIREQLIKTGVKGTSLHLGAVTPEVLNQLKASAKQNKFLESKQAINQLTRNAIKESGTASGNTSGLAGQARSRAEAEKVFKIQRNATQIVGSQVLESFNDPAFLKLRSEGAKGANTTILQQKGIAFPTFQRNIINELAQQDIQGKKSTENNINRILANSGFPNAGAFITPEGTLSGGEAIKTILNPINVLLGVPSDITPTSDSGSGGILDNILPETTPEEATGGLLSILTNPLFLFIVAFIVIALALRRSNKK